MSFFPTLFGHFPIKIKVKIQNEILRVKKTKEKIFIGKKGVSISCRRPVFEGGFILLGDRGDEIKRFNGLR